MVLPAVYYGPREDLAGVLNLSVPEIARAASFSIAGVAKLDQLQAVLDSLAQTVETGSSFAAWKDLVSGGSINLDLPEWRKELVFRNGTQLAYARGRFESFHENQESHPYLMYLTIGDDRVRPTHKKLHRFTARLDDPIWNTLYVPNGHFCRCLITNLTEEEAEQNGIAKSAPDIEADSGWDYNVFYAPLRGIKNELAKRRETLHPVFLSALESYDL